MSVKDTIIGSIEDDGRKVNASNVLKEIAIRHLKNKYGTASKYRPNTNTYWKLGDKVVRFYCCSDPRTIIFITTLSKHIAKSIKEEDAYFVGINYYVTVHGF